MARTVTSGDELDATSGYELLHALVRGEPLDDPVVLLVAHPDDESIGAASRLPQLRSGHIAVMTDGAPVASNPADPNRLAYARLRRAELDAALRTVGLADCLTCFGVPDQQSHTRLRQLVHRCVKLFESKRARLVLTHPYEGGHPDHDSAAFIARAAAELMRRSGRDAPLVIEMAFYSRSNGAFVAGRFMGKDEGLAVSLDDDARRLRARLLDNYVSQSEILSRFPRDSERFRIAPLYDFSAPPHDGALLYEHENWGCTGEVWRSAAGKAMRALRLGGSP